MAGTADANHPGHGSHHITIFISISAQLGRWAKGMTGSTRLLVLGVLCRLRRFEIILSCLTVPLNVLGPCLLNG